jgi:hypothetical protein
MLHETEWISVRAFPSSARVQRATKEKQPLDVPVFDRLRQSRNKSYQCSEHEKRYVEEAYSEARQWLDRSITWIRALTSPIFFLSKVQEPAKNALETHFKSSNTDTARVVLLNLEQIRGNIPTRREYQLAGSPGYQQEIAIGMGPRVPMTINAILCNGSECKPSTGAYYRSAISSITFCPHFFRRKAQAPGFLIHELAHSLGFGGSVLDYAYGQDRLYAGLTTAEAVLNADSYANFVEELATGKAKRMVAPQDRLAKCPDDWVPLVTAAIARAHQWARVAEKMYSGATTDPQAVAYQKVKDALVKSTTVSCRPAGAPQCQPGNSWFKDIGVSAIFLCPDWKGMSEDDRTIAVMAGLIGYFGGPGEKPDWEKYAAEAGALTRSKLNVAPITPPPAASTP